MKDTKLTFKRFEKKYLLSPQKFALLWSELEPHLTLAQHLLVEGVYYHDYTLVNATNHDVLVAAKFTPAPTVHTNGVWQMKGFTIPGTGKSAFPNTRTIRKETP